MQDIALQHRKLLNLYAISIKSNGCYTMVIGVAVCYWATNRLSAKGRPVNGKAREEGKVHAYKYTPKCKDFVKCVSK